MPTYEAPAVTRANPNDEWAAWVDVARRSDGDAIESAQLNGDFQEGSTIISKAKGFPRST